MGVDLSGEAQEEGEHVWAGRRAGKWMVSVSLDERARILEFPAKRNYSSSGTILFWAERSRYAPDSMELSLDLHAL